MSLVLHAGANPVEYEALRELTTPQATATHVPIPHFELVEMAKYALGYFGHVVSEEHHAVTEDGARYFGLLTLQSEYGDYTDTLGLRNAHDKSYPIGLAYGAKCFVCDNLSFIGDHVIKRKHTKGAKRALPGLVAEMVEPLQGHRKAQQLTFQRYQATEFSDPLVDHVLLTLYREGVLPITRVADVLKQWNEPEYDWGEKSAWRFFQATTFALTGKIAERPLLTQQLHRVLDVVCTDDGVRELAH